MTKRIDTQAISRRKRLKLRIVSGRMPSSAAQNDAKIIAVGNVKGGVGKTTLAVNLTICEALRGCDVLLIDGDEQGTDRAFTQLRAETLGRARLHRRFSSRCRDPNSAPPTAKQVSAHSY